MTAVHLPSSRLLTLPAHRTGDVVRRPGDVIRLGAGVRTLGLTGFAAASGRPGRLEVNAFRLVNDLPCVLDRPLVVAMQAGSLTAVPVCAGVALLAVRLRLSRDLALAGPLASSGQTPPAIRGAPHRRAPA